MLDGEKTKKKSLKRAFLHLFIMSPKQLPSLLKNEAFFYILILKNLLFRSIGTKVFFNTSKLLCTFYRHIDLLHNWPFISHT